MSVTEPALAFTPVISPMNEHDLLEVVEIERNSGLSPWGWDAYHRELLGPDRGLMWVSRIDSQVGSPFALAGYVVGRIAADELHINNIAVRDEFRRRKIGIGLLGRVFFEAKRLGAVRAVLEVRAGNSSAQALYQTCGFQIVGRRRNYYSNPPEDALIMTLELNETRLDLGPLMG